ncbi:MAG: S1C family serine protease [Aliidongia sp.]
MMHDDTIPPDVQPRPQDYPFDLDQVLSAIVRVRAQIPDDGFTTPVLGSERAGSGIVIDADGLVLTIGYLILEAESIWLTTVDGRAVPGHALAYDGDTGFGLVQVLGRLGVPALEFGDSTALAIGEAMILAAAGGRSQSVRTRLVGRQYFAGYWEYLLEDALYVAPHNPNWGGAGLIDAHGRLVGVGSLALQQRVAEDRSLNLNMVVPIDLVKPILESLRRLGRTDRPPRPWLGLYAGEEDDAVIVHGLAEGGPAETAGIQLGDHILAVGDAPVTDLRQLWQGIWASGSAGTTIRLRIARGTKTRTRDVPSADRMAFLRAPRLQ